MDKDTHWKAKDDDPRVMAKVKVFESYRDRQIRTEQDKALVR